MKRKINNRGFTLVELMVSTVILAIIAMGAGAFMVTGTRAYSSLNYTVRLQYEAQLAMAQLQELTVDCAKGITWAPIYVDGTLNKGTLYIANENEVHVFDYTSSTKTISYSYYPGSPAETLNFTIPGSIDAALLAEHVKSLTVAVYDDTGYVAENGDKAKRVEITLDMERGGKAHTATQVISLRNQPVYAKTWTALNSYI